MSPVLVLFILLSYFAILIAISVVTSKGATSDTFFTANRQSPWYLVAYGMIGASLSGVTFISVPASVGTTAFSYFQVVLGYLVGYWIIIWILLPLYYRLNLISIYSYFEDRFDRISYKTGSFFFLLSRSIGSSLRLFLAASVLQLFLFDAWGIPFIVTVLITIFFIWIYTFKGGIKTIVWTDTFQTTFLILAVVISVILIAQRLELGFGGLMSLVFESDYSRIFFFDDPKSTFFFPKQFFGGAFIAITMTGMDQDLMQKNLTCKNIGDAQKNMFWLSSTLVVVNLLFLVLGALLYIYSTEFGLQLPEVRDELFPMLAFNEFGLLAAVLFLLGITASTYASSDSALAALTTSFCVDFLNFKNKPEAIKQKQKNRVHVGFSILFLIIILIFKEVNERSLIDAVLMAATYTYGPLLGLFAFGVFTRRSVTGKLVPVVCLLAPVLCYLIVVNAPDLLYGYKVGYENLILNGLLTYFGLYLISKKEKATV
ncbi:MAG: sodium:solute symporter [Cyclobacteriaceae bacterium]